MPPGIKLRIAAAIVLVSAANAAQAQGDAFVMKPPKADENVEFKVIGGTKADPAKWPMTFVFSNPKGGGCTSTGIGERTIITAAHCIPNGAPGSVEIGGKRIPTVCTHHPAYKDVSGDEVEWEIQASPDFALCSLATALPGGLFEHVDVQGSDIRKDGKVHLLGFGCRKAGGSDGAFGVLYEGNSRITRVPSVPNYYTYTDGDAVCYGDSGGGAYQFQGPQNSRRLLVAINSRGNIAAISLLSTTKEQGFIDWAKAWAQSKNTRICGIHSDATGCRPQ